MRVYFLELCAVAPVVSSLMLVNSNNSLFTLNCTSSNSPATTVIWSKDGELLSNYFMYQTLRDGVTGTYDNVIEIDADISELAGLYSCSVLNSAGQSNVATVNVQGKITPSFLKLSFTAEYMLLQTYRLLATRHP